MLFGSIRRNVLSVCDAEGIEVCLTAPKLDELHDWDEAFISSTSRLVLPIRTIVVDLEEATSRGGGPPKQRVMFDDAPGPITQRIRELISADIAARSVEP